MTIKQIIEVVKHFEDGGEVECTNNWGQSVREDNWMLTETPDWNFMDYSYRAKPKEKRTLWFWKVLSIDGRWSIPTAMYTEEDIRKYHRKSIKFEKLEVLGFEYEN